MNVTIFSFAMSVLFSVLFIAAIHLLRNRPFFLRSFGVHTLLLLYALCFFRTVFVLELPFTAPVGLRSFYSRVYEAACTRIPVGDARVALWGILCGVWMAVSVVLLVQFLWNNIQVGRKLARFAPNRNAFADQVLERVKKESLRAPAVDVCICPSLNMPMGAGLLRKRIYLPAGDYTREEMYYILKHEYTHFCNRDLTVKFLVRLFCCVFWWNPAVHLLKRDVAQILEIKCDVKATQFFCKKERLAYLLAIVRVLKDRVILDCEPSEILATGLVFQQKKGMDVRERFELITQAALPVGWVGQTSFWAMAVAVFVFSYSFVFQSAFDPPMEDIYTDSSVGNYAIDGAYIVKDKNGKYSLILESGETISDLKSSALEILISEGFEIREE